MKKETHTMTQSQIAEVQKFITSLAYPCTRDEILAQVKRKGVCDEILDAVKELPDTSFMTPHAVNNALKN